MYMQRVQMNFNRIECENKAQKRIYVLKKQKKKNEKTEKDIERSTFENPMINSSEMLHTNTS